MPTYDYICNDCDHSFERFQQMSDKKIAHCPACGGDVKRLIGTGCPPIFNGPGFYCNDFPKKGRD